MPNKQYLIFLFAFLNLMLSNSCDEKKGPQRVGGLRTQNQSLQTMADTSARRPVGNKQNGEAASYRPEFTNDPAAITINEQEPSPTWGGMDDGSNPGFPPGLGMAGPPVPVPTDDEFGDLMDYQEGHLGSKIPFARGMCGNNHVDFNEECDDGNLDNTDGCDVLCQLPTCGNGITDKGETCDEGVNQPNAECGPRCYLIQCGNCWLEPGEQCDDCNLKDGDGCSGCCRYEICGNGIIDPKETCDLGKGLNINGSGCSPCCQLEICGDGELTPNEECEDVLADNSGCCKDCKLDCACTKN